MQVNWREIKWAKNSFAVLYAACEKSGITLQPVNSPERDITCYSLNSVNERVFRDEILHADCITIVGGPHASACYREVVKYADYVVVGEGEYTLPSLIRNIENNTGFIPPGVATKESYHPVDHCVYLNSYQPFSKVKGYIEITRGCPFGCSYCQTPRLFGRYMRHRSIDNIVKSAKAYKDLRFVSPNSFAYGSDGRHPRFDKFEKLLKALHSQNNVFCGTFPSEARPEFITHESLELINRYCKNRKVHFGAQSGSARILKLIHRGHTTEDVINAVELCREYDLVPIVDYIVGLPDATEEDQLATVEQIKWVARYGKVHAHYFTPLPGTPLAGKKPAELIPEVQRTLGKLSLNGRATGSWIEAGIRFYKDNENIKL